MVSFEGVAIVYTASDLVDANLIVDRLQQSRVRAWVVSASSHPDIPVAVAVEVADGDVARARKVLARHEEAQRGAADEIVCPHCGETNPGNFELCWSCRGDTGVKQ